MPLDYQGPFFLVFLHVALLLCPHVLAQGLYHSIADVFPKLAGLPLDPLSKSPGPGGMSWDICCGLAVDESLTIVDGNLAFVKGQTVLHGNISDVINFRYPCDRAYDGSKLDQPQVTVTWDWCNRMCPGWSITTSDQIIEWAQPLVAFIMPAVIFCLSVPRRRRLTVPTWLFHKRYGMLVEGISLLYRVPIASAIITLDTISWTIIIVSLSGPLLLSGLYEALLDVRIMRFLETRMLSNGLTIRQRTHMLLVVLLGNLDQDPAWDHSKRVIEELPNENREDRLRKASPTIPPGKTTSPATTAASPDALKSSGAVEASSQPSTYTLRDNKDAAEGQTIAEGRNAITQRHIEVMKVKLRSMIQAQSTFGVGVGAAVVFYIGSVCYTLVELESKLGSTRTAHHIAFGMFWMVVPHVAIISRLLLAGDNPNTWEGLSALPQLEQFAPRNGSQTLDQASGTRWKRIVCFFKADPGDEKSSTSSVVVGSPPRRRGLSGPKYDTVYRTAWMWDRGTCKAMWMARFVEEYPQLKSVREEVLRMGFEGWMYTVAPAMVLLVLPPFLGGLISYTTPEIGLSCRSMAMLTYVCSQSMLVILWILNWTFWLRDSSGQVRSSYPKPDPWPGASIAWYALFCIGLSGAFFTGIFGTVFLLMGLYRNCLCLVPIWYWADRHSVKTATSIGGANTINVDMARRFWLPCGIAAGAFLVGMAYVGWWYQRRVQAQFLDLVGKIDKIDDVDARENDELR